MKKVEAGELIGGLVEKGIEPVEISLESMGGVVDVIDPQDFTADVHSSISTPSSFLRAQVDLVLGSLTIRERKVLRLRFGLEDGKSRSFRQVGEEVGISKSTAWRTERDALRKLRNPGEAKTLSDYIL